MPIVLGSIVKGTVTGITKFGAFVSLENGENGLIHISEISKDYVENIDDFLKKGDEVTVKVIALDNKKIGLSRKQVELQESKKTAFKKPNDGFKKPNDGFNKNSNFNRNNNFNRNSGFNKNARVEPTVGTFEDKIERFLKESGEKNDQIKSRQGKKTGQRY